MSNLSKIEEIYHAALEKPFGEREDFLNNSCGDDDELRWEVESLLSFDEQAADFIETPPEDIAAAIFSKKPNDNLIGKILNHYRVISMLGAGGMGEVYLAEDTKLHRKTALKLLPTHFSENAERKARFEQEARAASALNHPNIITIYSIEHHENFDFMATEFIEGKTLRERITEKHFDWRETVEIALQITSALEAAHEVGIVHRDIKPANIMIRRDGYVKVLDFGLAKLTMPNAASGSYETRDQTAPNRVMGTINYMSPEQALGEKVDARTDIFSLGVVLYEMLSGNLPFTGETDSHTIVAILEKEPALIENLPAELQRIVRRTLTKDKKMRYQTAQDLSSDLKKLKRNADLQNTIDYSSNPNAGNENETRIYGIGANSASNGAVSVSSLEYAVKQAKSNKSATAIVGIVLLMMISAVAYFGFFNKIRTKQIESIAVMPFVNESGNADAEYLSDGMTETLISSLSKLPNLNVKARSIVFRYKGRESDLKKIAAELNVQAILNGRVVQRGDQLTLNLELIDANTENLIWSESYVRRQIDLVSLQSEIARDVSSKLKIKLSGADEAVVTKNYTANTEAYRLYLQGRYFWNQRTPEGIHKAIEQFKAATEIDPNYALAFVGLSDSYAVLEEYAGVPANECLPQAREYANRALQIDDQLSEAHTALGYLYVLMWQWSESEKEFARALELDPNNPITWHLSQIYLRNDGQLDKALARIKKGQELDPLSGIISVNIAVIYVQQNDPRAIDELKRAIELNPTWWVGHFWLGMIYLHFGQTAEAVSALEKSVELSNRTSMSLGALGCAYAVTGRRDEALAILKEVEKAYADRKAIGLNVASIYAGLGDQDQAFFWLEKDYQAHSSQLPIIKWYPTLISLHDDSRYQDLLRRMNLSE